MLIKKTFSKVFTVTLLAGSCVLLPALTGVNLAIAAGTAAENKATTPANTRRTPALRAKVYEQLSRAQALAERAPAVLRRGLEGLVDHLGGGFDVLQVGQLERHAMVRWVRRSSLGGAGLGGYRGAR